MLQDNILHRRLAAASGTQQHDHALPLELLDSLEALDHSPAHVDETTVDGLLAQRSLVNHFERLMQVL